MDPVIKQLYLKHKHGDKQITIKLGKSIGIQTSRDSIPYQKFRRIWVIDSLGQNFIRVYHIASYDTIHVDGRNLEPYYKMGYEFFSYKGKEHRVTMIKPKIIDRKIFWFRDIQRIIYASRDEEDETLKMAILSPIFILASPFVSYGKSGFTEQGLKFGTPMLATGIGIGVFYLIRKPLTKVGQYLTYDWEITTN